MQRMNDMRSLSSLWITSGRRAGPSPPLRCFRSRRTMIGTVSTLCFDHDDPQRHCHNGGPGPALRFRPVMPGDLVIEEDVFFASSATDVVDDQRRSARHCPAVADDADVRQIAGQHPGDEIADAVVGRARRDRQRPALTLESADLVRASGLVIDIAVRPTQAPFLRVFREMRAHVLVHALLQVDALGA